MNPIRVLIADDHVTVREGLVAIIGRQPDMLIVAEATDGFEVVHLWRQHRPDVTLLDIRMPGQDGVAAIHAIRTEEPTASILVLTTFDTDNDVSRVIKAGARGYLLKDAPRDELLAAVRGVHAGHTSIPPALVAKLAAAFGDPDITKRELQVLRLLASGSSNKEIGVKLNIGETTVKSHLRTIFGKLKVLSRTEAIATASKRGLIHL